MMFIDGAIFFVIAAWFLTIVAVCILLDQRARLIQRCRDLGSYILYVETTYPEVHKFEGNLGVYAMYGHPIRDAAQEKA